MTDDQLEHHCKLASIVTYSVRDPDFIRWLTEEADDAERQNTQTGLIILSEAFMALAQRQGVRPRFRVRAMPAARRVDPPSEKGDGHG